MVNVQRQMLVPAKVRRRPLRDVVAAAVRRNNPASEVYRKWLRVFVPPVGPLAQKKGSVICPTGRCIFLLPSIIQLLPSQIRKAIPLLGAQLVLLDLKAHARVHLLLPA